MDIADEKANELMTEWAVDCLDICEFRKPGECPCKDQLAQALREARAEEREACKKAAIEEMERSNVEPRIIARVSLAIRHRRASDG